MAFTSKLGTADSAPGNLELGAGAVEYPVGRAGSGLSFGFTLSGTGVVTPSAYPYIQSTGSSITGGTTLTLSFGSLPTAGNLIIIEVACATSGASGPISASDNQGNTYHLAASTLAFGFRTAILYAYNIGTPSGTFTVTTVDGSASYIFGAVIEYSGFVSGLDPLFSTGTTGFSGTPGSLSASVGTGALTGPCINAASIANYNVGATSIASASPAWVVDYNYGGFNGTGGHRVNTATGTQTVSWTAAGTNVGVTLAVFQDPLVFTPPRITQVVQSVVGQLPGAPVFATQIVQSLAAQGAERVKITQVVRTLVLAPPQPPASVFGCPEPPTQAITLCPEDGFQTTPACDPLCDCVDAGDPAGTCLNPDAGFPRSSRCT